MHMYTTKSYQSGHKLKTVQMHNHHLEFLAYQGCQQCTKEKLQLRTSLLSSKTSVLSFPGCSCMWTQNLGQFSSL